MFTQPCFTNRTSVCNDQNWSTVPEGDDKVYTDKDNRGAQSQVNKKIFSCVAPAYSSLRRIGVSAFLRDAAVYFDPDEMFVSSCRGASSAVVKETRMNMQDRAETTQSCLCPAAEADKPEVDVLTLHDCTQETSPCLWSDFLFLCRKRFPLWTDADPGTRRFK